MAASSISQRPYNDACAAISAVPPSTAATAASLPCHPRRAVAVPAGPGRSGSASDGGLVSVVSATLIRRFLPRFATPGTPTGWSGEQGVEFRPDPVEVFAVFQDGPQRPRR